MVGPAEFELLAALDAAEGAGAPPHLVAWLRAMVRAEAESGLADRRLDAIERILRDCFGTSRAEDLGGDAALFFQVRAWLEHVDDLIRGLRIRFHTPRADSVRLAMSFSVGGRTFRQEDEVILAHDPSVALDRCYARLDLAAGRDLDRLPWGPGRGVR